MSEVILYENTRGRKTIKLNKICRSRKIRLARHVPMALLFYMLLLVMSVLIRSDWMVALGGAIGLWLMIPLFVLASVVIIVGYCLFSEIVFRRKYEYARSSIHGYSTKLSRLSKIYEAEDFEKRPDDTRKIDRKAIEKALRKSIKKNKSLNK